MARSLRKIYRLKVQLSGLRPPVWRRLLVTDTTSLADFHTVIQAVMGWTDSHLHQFIVGKRRYGLVDPEFGMDWDDDLLDESGFKVKDLLKKEGDSLTYEYDFGDSWMHKITLEKIEPHSGSQFLPVCLTGKRACPPEDVGGVYGYLDFLEKWQDETHPEYSEIREWAGDYFLGPEDFDLAETNEVLHDLFGSE